MSSQRGITLLTTLLIMVISFSLTGAVIYFISRGFGTYSSYKLYEKAFNKAQGGIEQALLDIEDMNYFDLQTYSNSSTTGAQYEIYQVFWSPLTGFGGSINFPPASSAYSGVFGVGVFYLIHSSATEGESKSDIYALYIKGY